MVGVRWSLTRAARPLSPPSSLDDSPLDDAATDGADEDAPDFEPSLTEGRVTNEAADLEEDVDGTEVGGIEVEDALNRGILAAALSFRWSSAVK